MKDNFKTRYENDIVKRNINHNIDFNNDINKLDFLDKNYDLLDIDIDIDLINIDNLINDIRKKILLSS